MSEGTYINKQITKYMTTKKLLEFNDKLRLPPLEYYAHVHANGDKNSSGKNVTSLIGITMLDYSNGKGDKTVSVEANITPDDLMFVLDNIRRGAQTYENSQDKIFGEPDKDGKCQVTKLSIKRSPNMNYPWCIEIENGKGVKEKNAQTGGSYIKSGTYTKEASVKLNLTDYDLYKQLWRVEQYINIWGLTYVPQRIRQAKEIVAKNTKESGK